MTQQPTHRTTDTSTQDVALVDDPGRADGLVMFGLTGDLGDKKLVPALVELAAAGVLDHPVVAVGRSGLDTDELRRRLAEALSEHETLGDDRRAATAVGELELHYVRGGVDDDETWHRIGDRLTGAERPVVYAALPPGLFGTIAERVAGSSLPDGSRLVVEKPFGHDAASARELWDDVTARISAEQVFVVDHFLAKTAIENLLVVRTCNAMIANNLRPGLVERIDVLMHETGGVDGRGSFYESVGAVRDVVQNHMLQLLALATMPRPADDSDAAYLDARRALLAAIDPIDVADVTLGQYVGYRDLDDVADDSEVETFASLELSIDVDPWRGVPVRFRTGKQLHEQRTAVVFTIRSDVARGHGRLVFDVSPSPCISIELDVLAGDDDHTTRTMILAGRPDSDHDGLGDYATMLRGALHGERRHFATIDDILAGWRIVDPIAEHRLEVEPYEPGSTGP
jgi:glucose-6-phosphate 1-dehydrogenase